MSKRSYAASGSSTTSYAQRKNPRVSRTLFAQPKKRGKVYPTVANYKAAQREIAKLIDKRILSKKELKYGILTTNTDLINAVSGTTAPISLDCTFDGIDQGDDINDRIGNTIQLVKARITFDLDAGASGVDDTVMVYMVKSIGAPGTQATVGTYSDQKFTLTGGQQGIQSSTGFENAQLPWNNREYRVYYEERFLVSSVYQQEGSVSHMSRTVDMTKFFKKMQTFGTATGAGVERITCYFVPLTTLSTATLNMRATFTAEFVDA